MGEELAREGAHVRIRLPGGALVEAGPDAIIGRSPAAVIRLTDPRISTIHAELSWRPEGPCLIARGGRLRVAGRAAPTVPLQAGLRVELVPGVSLEVVEITVGEVEVIPPTTGRERLHWTIGPAEVTAALQGVDEPAVRLTGISARLAAALLEAEAAQSWDQIAAVVWPEDAALRSQPQAWLAVDERRLRNRWDQALRQLRQQLAPLRTDTVIEVGGGTVAIRLHRGDTVRRQP